MRRTPTGQRPQLNQKTSAGWSWPRLLPIHEQQARASLVNHSPTQSSKAHSVRKEKKRSNSATDMEEKNPAEGNYVSSKPVASDCYETSPPSNSPAGPIHEEASGEAAGSVSPTSETCIQSLKKEEASSSEQSEEFIQDASDPPDTGTIVRRGTKSNVVQAHASSNDDDIRQSVSQRSVEDEPSIKQQSDASSMMQNVAVPIDETRGNEDNEFTNDVPELTRENLDKRRKTVTSETADRHPRIHDKHIIDSSKDNQLNNTNVVSESPIASEHQDLTAPASETRSEEVPIASEYQESSNISFKTEEQAETAKTPIPPVRERVSISVDRNPYHAAPKIMVHKPSQSSQSENSGPRTIDEILAGERTMTSPPTRSLKEGAPASPISSVIAQPLDTPTGAGVRKVIKVKRRSLYLRKARNLVARETILKMTLGRQLATPTKQALKRLAHGETVIEEDPIGSRVVS